jgi:hypothetical protein
MSKSSGNSNETVWNTKYGTRRVRVDLPTMQEAVFAAQGLTDDLEEQVEIAAALIGASEEEIRAEIARSRNLRQVRVRPRSPTDFPSEPRTFVVERKGVRRSLMNS